MDSLGLLKRMLINSSVGTSAVRSQGNGIAEPIREKLKKEILFDEFFSTLKSDNPGLFKNYLNKLTNKIHGMSGESNNDKEPGKVEWGTARKCINMVLRSVVYNGFIWTEYELKKSDFGPDGIMNKLELPLDSHVVAGIKKDCRKYDIEFATKKYSTFSIVGLNKKDNHESLYYQSKALLIAARRQVCRIDLDLYYWRSQNESDESLDI
jgi:hypothetical protein